MKKAFALTAAVAALATAAFASGVSAQEATGTIKKMKDSGKVVMGVRDAGAPLSYTTGAGAYTGMHPEMCLKVLDAIKAQYKIDKLQVEYMLVTSQNRIPLVENGTVDIECGTTTNNTARQKQVAFVNTTFVTEVRMAVNAKSGITSLAQLNGKNVVTTTGSTSVQLLRKHEKATGIDFKEVYGKDMGDSFLILETGRADAFVMDDNILAGNIANSKNPADWKIVGEAISVEPIAIMLRKDDPQILKAFNDAYAAMVKNGDFEKLYNKWFLSPIPPKNSNVNMPMSGTLKAFLGKPNSDPVEALNKK
jgi:glutamate/aspartate transport system substrate-binding protein